ncbi:MAG: 7-cyano-7-deazaguanine synthase QueC [Legionellales bacterium]|nr:7-cyano-7-deazaguanine synthase QueC [Legionellales bacterium]
MNQAVILLSGGLDSTTCLAIAKSQGFQCTTLSFDYGQRHVSELKAAHTLSQALGATDHRVVRLDMGQFGTSALTDLRLQVPEYSSSSAIPVTYVPARNTVFLSLALGLAESIQAYDIFIGANAVDYSNYPDCRPEFIQAFQALAMVATKASVEGKHVTIHAPLLHMTKAEIIQTGVLLGVNYRMTVSCYQASPDGAACGRCDSCVLRLEGFLAAHIKDPTMYQTS